MNRLAISLARLAVIERQPPSGGTAGYFIITLQVNGDGDLIERVDFDGIDPEKRLSLTLAHKPDLVALKDLIHASAQRDLKPVEIFNAEAFERFQFQTID